MATGQRDWANLQVSAATRRFIKETGFKRMTPVQAISIPLLLNHRDVAVEACTGSGKTLAFLIPTVEILMRRMETSPAPYNVGATVLAPTRELAGQIHEVLGGFLDAVDRELQISDATPGLKLRKQLFVGGADGKAAAAAIRRVDAKGDLQIVVATPGRMQKLMNLVGREVMSFKTLEILVLDEADRLLQLGFSHDLDAILSQLPKQRRTGLFSATLTSELQQLMKSGMRNPVHVCVRLKRPDAKPEQAAVEGASKAVATNGADAKPANGGTGAPEPEKPAAGAKPEAGAGDDEAGKEGSAPARKHELPTKLQNYFAQVPGQDKLGFLCRFLQRPDVKSGKTIVFFLTCACVDYFHVLLRGLIDLQATGGGKKAKKRSVTRGVKGGRVEKLHGQMDQTARTRAYDKFCNAPAEDGVVLLATDLAARGIDVEAVSWIVQFDAPIDPSNFVHRIGRTARAGQSGQSLVMTMPSEDSYVPFLKQRGIPLEELPAAEGAGESEAIAVAKQRARKLVESDRAVMLKSSKAFTSYVRAYQEHTLSFIFPFKGLDLGAVATGFCLLRLPRMKEILGRKIKNFEQSSVHPASVPFRDKTQEKQRQERLEKDKEARDEEIQSGRAKAKERAEERRKEKEKAKAEKRRTRTQQRWAKRNERAEEWKLLQAEEGLAKKLRSGKITATQFNSNLRKATKRIIDRTGNAADADSDDEDASSDEPRAKKVDGKEENPAWLIPRKKRRTRKGKK